MGGSQSAVLFLFCVIVSSLAQAFAASTVPALFVFGDSIVDSGNNVFVRNSTAVADFPPYGVDFFAATGRFTNARILTDVLGQLLGLPDWIPCNLAPTASGENILHGLNYASAGSGILDNTTTNAIVIPLNDQIAFFENSTLPELKTLLGENLTSYLARSIFAFNSGANDYITYCFGTTLTCDLPKFTDYLISVFVGQLKRMYSYGARKFVLFSTEACGCTPVVRNMGNGSCSDLYTYGAILFNNLLNSSIDKLNEELPGSSFVFANVYTPLMDIIANPSSYGFEVVTSGCCETSTASGGDVCVEDGTVCDDRSVYVYFDGGHPTDRVNAILSRMVYYSNLTSIAYPFNVEHLASIDVSASASAIAEPSESLVSYGRDVQ
ncbi:unnamed protein product [Victoria cruziana]